METQVAQASLAEAEAGPQRRHPLGLGLRPAPLRAIPVGSGGCRDSTSDGVAAGEPALQNKAGEYNCFLNAVVQCLWHCTAFKEGLLRLPADALQARGPYL